MVLGMPFLFVPISVMSYVGVPQEKNNEVSGLTALARNIGGSLGISFISTMLVRRAQAHQQFLASHVYGGSPKYLAMQHGLAGAMQKGGYSTADAARRSAAQIYNMMLQQARLLAYIDTVHVLVFLTACLIPIGYLMKKPRFRSVCRFTINSELLQHFSRDHQPLDFALVPSPMVHSLTSR